MHNKITQIVWRDPLNRLIKDFGPSCIDYGAWVSFNLNDHMLGSIKFLNKKMLNF